MLKTTKRYILNTNAVNNYGFRLLSEGIDMSAYKNNPLMLWMHYRPTGSRTDEVLALGNVKEIEIDADGVMTGQPYFDDTYDFAKTIYNKYENGTYNMFSTCALPVEVSMEGDDLLPGQTGPTFTHTLLKEFSCVDIGGNPGAYGVELCDESGALIKLSEGNYDTLKFIKTKNTQMAKLTTIAVAGLLPLIKLTDDATEAETIKKLTELIQLADANNTELIQLRGDKSTLTIERDTAKNDLAAAIKKHEEVQLKDLGEMAVLQRKVTKKEFDELVELADGKFEKVKKIIDGRTASPTIRETLTNSNKAADKGELVKLTEQSFDDLFKNGGLARLRDLDPEAYKDKYREKYGKDPVNS